MCKTTNNGYKMQDGAEVKFANIDPDTIPEAVKKELEQSPASQLDILYIRANNHRNAKLIDELNSTVQNIDVKLDKMINTFTKQLVVEVVNGKKQERPITELIGELWELHHDARDVSVIRSFVWKHRRIFLFLAGLFVFSNLLFRQQLHAVIDWIANNIETIFKWIY